MNLQLLNLLECPFCGGQFRVDAKTSTCETQDEISSGILLCDCCAYPVVGGIPYLRTGPEAERAMQWLGKSEFDQALALLLGVLEQPGALGRLKNSSLSFREALHLLDRSAESQYLLYRFSDPTFLASEALLCTLRQLPGTGTSNILDLCGGTGHLTRSIARYKTNGRVVLADLSFWKLYLAKRFIVPEAEVVCCNANDPLPFASSQFSFVSCTDAFHYIWSKKQFAHEMLRVASEKASIALPHVHNGLLWNPSEGMPLSPEAYVRFFCKRQVQAYEESQLLKAALSDVAVSLEKSPEPACLNRAPAFSLLVTPEANVGLRLFPQAWAGKSLTLNPLYQPAPEQPDLWRLGFPTSEYEQEYEACKSYLPKELTLRKEQFRAAHEGRLEASLNRLAAQRVFLDLPPLYL